MNIVITFNPYREADAAQTLATQLRSADPDVVVVLSAQPDRYWGEDTRYPVSDWQQEAANDYTRQGYWEWVQSQRENGAEGREDEDTDEDFYADNEAYQKERRDQDEDHDPEPESAFGDELSDNCAICGLATTSDGKRHGTDEDQSVAPVPVQRPSRAILARDVTAADLALDSPGPEGWNADDVIGTKGSDVTVLDRDKAEAIGDSVEARDFDRDFTASGFIPLDALEGR